MWSLAVYVLKNMLMCRLFDSCYYCHNSISTIYWLYSEDPHYLSILGHIYYLFFDVCHKTNGDYKHTLSLYILLFLKPQGYFLNSNNIDSNSLIDMLL